MNASAPLPRVGFVGLGVMGRPMASHLSRAGCPCSSSTPLPASPPTSPATLPNAVAAASPAALAAASDIVVTMVPNGEVVRSLVVGDEGLLHGFAPRRAAARHLLLGALADRGHGRGARRPRRRHGRCAGLRRRMGRAGGRAGVHGRRRARRPRAGAAAARGDGQGGVPRRRPRRGPCDEVPQQPDHLGQPARPERRPGDGQALRARSGGDGRRAQRLDRHVVGRADAHQAARDQPPLRRSVQAGADGQGHRHRDGARPRHRHAGAASALAQELWRAAAAAAEPNASVSELVRWVERASGTEITAGAAARERA